MTPTEARAAFLWSLTTPEQVMAAATTPELREAAAKRLGVSLRTVQRHANAFLPCPCPCCLTSVRGGGVCRFCSRPDHAAARMGTTGVSGESDRLTRGAASVLTPPASRRSSSGVRR